MITDTLLLSAGEIISDIFKAFEQKQSLLLTYLNQHSFNIYFKNEKYKKMLDSHFRVYQADSGIFLYLKFIKRKKVSRIDGTNLNQKIFNKIIEDKIPVTIIGGKFQEKFIAEKCYEKNIILSGYHHGYFSEQEFSEVIDKIKLYNSRFTFIGMGVPKQEYFAYELSRETENKIIICAGNFFEFYFGSVKRSPLLFRKAGIEWLYRLFTEPKRLWKRYLIGIPQFIYRVLTINSEKK